MNTELDREFQQKEEQYLTEKKQIENRLEEVMHEKRAFRRYLDQLANQVNYPTPYYDETPDRQVVYRLLKQSEDEAEAIVRNEQMNLEHALEEKQKNLQKERMNYEKEKRARKD